MKIYTAHNFAARGWITENIVPKLEGAGHQVTSRWLTSQVHVASTPNSREQSAIEDLEDVAEADTLLLFIDQYGERPGRGKYVELGYALGLGKKVVLCGSNEGCIFYSLPNLYRVADIDEFLSLEDSCAFKA